MITLDIMSIQTINYFKKKKKYILSFSLLINLTVCVEEVKIFFYSLYPYTSVI